MAQNMAISFTCCTACATASRPLFQSGVSSATAAAAEAASASSDAYERTRLGTGSPPSGAASPTASESREG